MANKLRELMLLRHAKTDWKDDGLEDIERPLSDKGKKNAAKMGKWLKEKNLMPDLILVSPAVRAQQTLKRICNECSATAITVDALYLAELEQLRQVLADAPHAERIMLIGHNPGLETLFNLLVSEQPPSHVQLFPTCALAHLILPNDWQNIEAGDGKLQQFITPKEIKNKQ
ncbi:MAG: histidine phosphatase family protein [Thiomicrorhabdus sp.]|nr:histidine phosphatase family protein [Thiomicrorhabdus sp.]